MTTSYTRTISFNEGGLKKPKRNTAAPKIAAADATFRSVSLGSTPLLQPHPEGRLASRSKVPLASSKAAGMDDKKGTELLQLKAKEDDTRDIPRLPQYHCLERTCVEMKIGDQLTCQNLMHRIHEFLRLNSIEFSVEKDEGRSCCFDCVTPNMLKFVIQLWRRGGDETNNTRILIELQRRQGGTIEMHRLRKRFYESVVLGEEIDESQSSYQRRLPLLGCSEMACLMTMNQREDSYCQEAVSIALQLLDSLHTDQKQLGLESLSILTNADLVLPEDAREAARVVVFAEGSYGDRIQGHLKQYFQGYNQTLTSHEQDFAKEMHHLALQTLANSLEAIHKSHNDREEEETSLDAATPFWLAVYDCMIYNLKNASHRPQEGALSAKCFRLFPSVIRNKVSQDRGRISMENILAEAHAFGKSNHKSLEIESRCLMFSFGITKF